MKREIYNNYNLWETWPDETLKEIALECEWVKNEEDITENDLIEWRYEQDQFMWDATKEELSFFFGKEEVIFFGSVGRWDGNYSGAEIGEFWKVFYDLTKDCDFFNIYDDNGRFIIECSHHDGNNSFQVKTLKPGAQEFYDRWNYGTDDRPESKVYEQIIKRYSVNPHFAKKVYG